MKSITAYIKPLKLDAVTSALQKIPALRGMSIAEVKGFGRQEKDDSPCPATDNLLDLARYVRIEIFCNDDIVQEIVSTIDRTARTGLRGDGKIYVADVVSAYKIGNGTITL
jgi:nitrogen regulatory protein PII